MAELLDHPRAAGEGRRDAGGRAPPAAARGASTSDERALGVEAFTRLTGFTSPGETREYSIPRVPSVLATWPRATSARRATEVLPLGSPECRATSAAVARASARTAVSTTASRSLACTSVPVTGAGALGTVGGPEIDSSAAALLPPEGAPMPARAAARRGRGGAPTRDAVLEAMAARRSSRTCSIRARISWTKRSTHSPIASITAFMRGA